MPDRGARPSCRPGPVVSRTPWSSLLALAVFTALAAAASPPAAAVPPAAALPSAGAAASDVGGL